MVMCIPTGRTDQQLCVSHKHAVSIICTVRLPVSSFPRNGNSCIASQISEQAQLPCLVSSCFSSNDVSPHAHVDVHPPERKGHPPFTHTAKHLLHVLTPVSRWSRCLTGRGTDGVSSGRKLATIQLVLEDGTDVCRIRNSGLREFRTSEIRVEIKAHSALSGGEDNSLHEALAELVERY